MQTNKTFVLGKPSRQVVTSIILPSGTTFSVNDYPHIEDFARTRRSLLKGVMEGVMATVSQYSPDTVDGLFEAVRQYDELVEVLLTYIAETERQ